MNINDIHTQCTFDCTVNCEAVDSLVDSISELCKWSDIKHLYPVQGSAIKRKVCAGDDGSSDEVVVHLFGNRPAVVKCWPDHTRDYLDARYYCKGYKSHSFPLLIIKKPVLLRRKKKSSSRVTG